MNGSEKQITWANEILTSFMVEWDQYSSAAITTLAERAENYEAKGKERGARFAREDVATIETADKILRSLDDAGRIIDNRDGVFNLGFICHSHGAMDIVSIAKHIGRAHSEGTL